MSVTQLYPGRCDHEVRDASGRWTRCGRPALWWWPFLGWEVCDQHARYEDAKRRGELVEGIVPLTRRSPLPPTERSENG